MSSKFSDYRNPAIEIPEANPDIFLGNNISCEISSVRFNVVFLCLCNEVGGEGKKHLEPANIPYSITYKDGKKVEHREIPANASQPAHIPIEKGRARLSFKIDVEDDLLIHQHQFRLVVYETPSSPEPFIQSSLFRARKYRLSILLPDSFPPTEGKYYYEAGERLLRFQVDLVDRSGAKVKSCVQLQCDVYDKNGELCNNQITKPAWENWWEIENRSNEADYALPCDIKFGCRNSVHTAIHIRVSVLNISFPPGISAKQVGSAQTTPFYVYSKHPTSIRKRQRLAEARREEAGAASAEEDLGFLRRVTSEDPDISDRYYAELKRLKDSIGEPDENYKSLLKIWMDIAIAALENVYSADSIENIDKQRIFNVLFGYHAWQIEKCIASADTSIPMHSLTDDIVTVYNTNGAAMARSAYTNESQNEPQSTQDKQSRGRTLLQRGPMEQMVASRNPGGVSGQITSNLSAATNNPTPLQILPDHPSQLVRGIVGSGRALEAAAIHTNMHINNMSISGVNSFGDMASRVHEPMRSVESLSYSFNVHLFQDRNKLPSRSASIPGSATASENAFIGDAEKWESARSLCELSASTSLERMMNNSSHNYYDVSSLGGLGSSVLNSIETNGIGGASSGSNSANYISVRHNSFADSPSLRMRILQDAPLNGLSQASNEGIAHIGPIQSSSSNRRVNIPPNAAYVCLHKFKHFGLPVFDVSYYLLGFVRLENHTLLFFPDPKNLKNYEYDRLKGICYGNAKNPDVVWDVTPTQEFRETLIARILSTESLESTNSGLATIYTSHN